MKSMPLKLALVAGLGLAFAGATTYAPAASAQVYVTTSVVGVAPPPPRYERIPRARPGYVWAPGYWRWDGRLHRHVWAGGYWVPARPGYTWHPAYWDHAPNGWRFREGYWAR
jgi:hypothetical protein